MRQKWILLAAEMLDTASGVFSNHGCNDMDWPSGWTIEEKREFKLAMHVDNGDPEEFDPEHLELTDWWVMAFLASRLRKTLNAE